MRRFTAISVASLSLAVTSAPHAATITSSLSDWQAAVGAGYTTTTDFGVANNTSTNAVELADGQTLTFGFDTVYNNPGYWNLNGYTGQVIDTGFGTETIRFGSAVSALGFIIEPGAEVTTDITVTLSDNTSLTIPAVDFTTPGATQFIGFYDGDVSSITLSFSNDEIIDFAFGDIVDTVPEPMSMALLLSGITGLSLVRRKFG